MQRDLAGLSSGTMVSGVALTETYARRTQLAREIGSVIQVGPQNSRVRPWS